MHTRRSFVSYAAGALFCTGLALTSPGLAAQELPSVEWLLVSTEPSSGHHYVQDLQKFADNVAERTEGRFKIRIALEGELGFKRDSYARAIQRNQVQMASFDPGFLTAQIPHVGVFNLTFLQDGSLEQLMALEQATRELTIREIKKLNAAPIAWHSTTSQEIISAEPIPDFTDLQGLKIRVWRDLDAQLIEKMNGVPVYLPGSEVYPAMQRGVVSAANTGTPGMVDRSLQEVGKYLYRFGGPPSSQYVVYNIDAFDDLPDEYKRALFLAGWKLTDRGRETVLQVDAEAVAKMKAEGVEEFEIPADQRKVLQELATPLWEQWAAENPTNQQALDAAREALGL